MAAKDPFERTTGDKYLLSVVAEGEHWRHVGAAHGIAPRLNQQWPGRCDAHSQGSFIHDFF